MNKGRKISGGKYHANRKSRLYAKRNQERYVFLGETKGKSLHTRGGHEKHILLKSNEANILIVKGKENKVERAKITNVLETPSNKFLARQNRLMKGALIETSLGKARVTNRPTQEGHINAVLIEAK